MLIMRGGLEKPKKWQKRKFPASPLQLRQTERNRHSDLQLRQTERNHHN